MTDERTKVKDLATELAVTPKDVVQAMRDLNIPVRNTASTIPVEALPRLREHFRDRGKEDSGESRPGVIVRHRKRPVPQPQAETLTTLQENTSTATEPAPAEKSVVSEAAGAGENKSHTTRERPRKRPRDTAFVARVISRPQDQTAAAAEAAAKALEEARLKVQAEAKAVAEKQEKAERPRRQQPAASASPEGSSAPKLLQPFTDAKRENEAEHRDRHKRRPPKLATPQVRIISRPSSAISPAPRLREPGYTDENRDSRRPTSGGRQRPGSYQNQLRQGGGYQAQRAGATPGVFNDPLSTPDRDGQSKKKRNKGSRRGQDFQDTTFAWRNRRDEDADEMPRSRSFRKSSKARATTPASQTTQPLKAAKRKLRIEESIRVSDMAHQMGLKANEIIKVLFNLGVMATINKALDIDTAGVVAAEFGYEVEKVGFTEEEYLSGIHTPDTPEQLRLRPPVVTIMGHVDHGKTSLLDAIRKTNVTSGEAGGITQHIGAYHVKTKRGEIVFLDTPGHEAFTAMRARGAQVTDIVVLVVAADDGVMEQTREAINHSRAANVPIMVAVNKIDKPTANPDRVLQELASLGLVPEEWGGDTVVCKVSAKTREGLDDMLEMLALQADILELKANPDKLARGHIVEAKLDRGRGPVATVLIQEGTLHQGDTFVCGVFSGRVRALFDDQFRKVKEAGPSIPVEVQGFDGVPEAGEEFI